MTRAPTAAQRNPSKWQSSTCARCSTTRDCPLSWTYALPYWSQVRNRSPLLSNLVDKEDTVGASPYSTYFPNATNDVSNFAIFGAFATVHLTKPRMRDLHRHSKLDLHTLSGVYVGLISSGRSRTGVIIYVGVLQKVIIVRQCSLDVLALGMRPRVSIHVWHCVFFPKLLGWLPRPKDRSQSRHSARDPA